MLTGGVAVVDITPPPGLQMTGYAARTRAAVGAHDPLTVRALVINDTALVVCDVIGIHEDMSARIRQRACLPDGNIILTALHNHGAPASMRGRLGENASEEFLEQIEFACIRAIEIASAQTAPCQLITGYGGAPGIAINRRHSQGLVDDSLPVLCVTDMTGCVLATVVSYACHPVVLGADNLFYTADYPYYVRQALEERYQGSVALFVTGAAGDANSGHLAKDSISLAADNKRTFAEAQRIGKHIAHLAGSAALSAAGVQVRIKNKQVALSFERQERIPVSELADLWRHEMPKQDKAQQALLSHWIRWADRIADEPLSDWTARVSILQWGSIKIVALPGEIFAATARDIRELCVNNGETNETVFVAAYADANPGYIPPDEEYAYGGYEIDEAHRYYGMAATFAPGSVNRLIDALKQML